MAKIHGKDLNARTPELQHRHFAFIARVIKEELVEEPIYHEEGRVVALKFARRLAGTNPNFDRARFMAACGVEE